MRQRLTENIIVKASAYHKIERPLTESEQTLLVEGTPYKALAIYRFEFTRPGQKNLNGRIYPYALWDKVLAAGLVTLALMDHPAEGAGNPLPLRKADAGDGAALPQPAGRLPLL